MLDSIVTDEEYGQTKRSSSKDSTLALLLGELAVEVVGIFKEEVASGGQDSQVERKLEKAADDDVEHIELDDLDDVDLATIKKLEEKGVRVIYPNLKYRKPKYENVGDILKYVESEDDGKGGVKLVIMNFND